MRRRRDARRRRLAVTLAGAAVAAAALALWGLAADHGSRPTTVSAATDAELARSAAQRFLDTYMDAEGRVVRTDQGSDTVSEGQAYAMLLSVAIGDRDRFQRAWEWARTNLQRDDALLASRWQDGQIADDSPAADADLDAARALIVAGERFDEAAYRTQGLEVAAAVLAHETVSGPSGPVLVAGPWARDRPPIVNPSYFDPRAFSVLGSASGDSSWPALERSSREILTELTDEPPSLPPDWARVTAGGAVAQGPPENPTAPARYGFEAVRVPVRWAAACAGENRALAAAPWRFLAGASAGGGPAGEYALDGSPLSATGAPALVGAAAAAAGAGDLAIRDSLLERAESAATEAPSYYGAAWVALGRVMLTTDWLAPC